MSRMYSVFLEASQTSRLPRVRACGCVGEPVVPTVHAFYCNVASAVGRLYAAEEECFALAHSLI